METSDIISYLLTPAAQVALIIGLAEVAKRLGLDKRFIPILDLVLGLASGIFVFGLALGYGVVNGIMVGIACGLSACGLFSGIKNVFEKKEE